MKLKILDPNDGTQMYLSFADFFDLNNPGEYELYEDSNYAGPVDFLIQNHIAYYPTYSMYDFKKLLLLEIRHSYEDHIASLNQDKTDRVVVTPARDFNVDDPRILFNDYYFNRTKAYYLDYTFTAKKVWYYESKLYYVILENTSPENKTKIYIAPNRTYFDPENPQQRVCRKQLMNLLKTHYNTFGYLGDPADPDIGGLPATAPGKYTFGGFRPPHNKYYEDSFISIYAETIEYGSTFLASEKTFSPLIKGHFVLPFGNYQFIKNVKQHYGFQFPDFIDYSYDLIENKEKRYQSYQTEIKRLLSIPIDVWREHWSNNLLLLQANQQIFYNRPYHLTSLIDVLE